MRDTIFKKPQTSFRKERVGECVRAALSPVLLGFQPAAHEAKTLSVLVTRVKMSPDLRHAVVFIIPCGQNEEGAACVKLLNLNRGRLTKKIAPSLSLKFMPLLKFVLDDGLEAEQKLHDLFSSARVKDDLSL